MKDKDDYAILVDSCCDVPIEYQEKYASSSNGKYYVVSEMEYIQSISELLKATNFFVFVGLVIFLITIFISVFISYILYKPFLNIFRNIRNMFGDSQNKNNLNEVQLLSDTFTKMVDKLNSLEKENDNNEVIKMLTSRDNLEEAFSTDILLKTGIIEKETSPYIIVVVKIDEFEVMSENNNREALLFQLNSVNTIVNACFNDTRDL